MPKLWYTKPAGEWLEALPLGNGRLGAMVFGDPRQERLALNEATFWSGGPYDPVRPGAHVHLGEVRRLLKADRYQDAEALCEKELMGSPKRL